MAVRPKKVLLPVVVTTPGHAALLGDAAGIGGVARPLRDRQRFAGQRGLIDAEIFAVDEEEVGRDDLAAGDADHVAGDELGGVDRRPRPVAQHPRLGGEALLQRLERVGGLVVLPEADGGVVEEEPADHEEIGPVAAEERDQRGRLDHPGQRTPEIAGELVPAALGVGLDGVPAIARKPGCRLGGAQSLRRRAELAQLGGDGVPRRAWPAAPAGGLIRGLGGNRGVSHARSSRSVSACLAVVFAWARARCEWRLPTWFMT